MQKLIEGIHQFQQTIFDSQKRLFERLEQGQQPMALFITCSDSWINPNLLTQTEPGFPTSGDGLRLLVVPK